MIQDFARSLSIVSSIVVVLGAVVGCASNVSAQATDDSDLINAKPAEPGEVPSTLHIAASCTATKIAPKMILTAAHCVLDLSNLAPLYGEGKPLKIGNASHTVARLHVHPKWMSVCEETLCSISAVTLKIDAPDIAILELESDLAGIPVTPVDSTPLEVGDDVMLVGYGCTDGVHVRGAGGTLATKEAKIIAPAQAIHEGSPLAENNLAVYSGNYALTAGPAAANGEAAGLCPGDSGGPLYAKRNNKLVVVGVNANYTLRPDEQDGVGLPVTNWHTRLDSASRNQVGAFLDSVLKR